MSDSSDPPRTGRSSEATPAAPRTVWLIGAVARGRRVLSQPFRKQAPLEIVRVLANQLSNKPRDKVTVMKSNTARSHIFRCLYRSRSRRRIFLPSRLLAMVVVWLIRSIVKEFKHHHWYLLLALFGVPIFFLLVVVRGYQQDTKAKIEALRKKPHGGDWRKQVGKKQC